MKVVLFISLCAGLAYNLVTNHGLDLVYSVWTLPVSGLALFSADVLTGLVHIVLDKHKPNGYLPLLDHIARRFQDHHQTPQRIVLRSSRELLEQTAMFVPLPLSRWCYIQIGESPNYIVTLFVFILSITSFCGQITHRWSHAPKRPVWVSWLQNHRFILDPATHHRHHQDYDRDFCTLNGWGNVVVNQWRQFPNILSVTRIVLAIVMLTGQKMAPSTVLMVSMGSILLESMSVYINRAWDCNNLLLDWRFCRISDFFVVMNLAWFYSVWQTFVVVAIHALYALGTRCSERGILSPTTIFKTAILQVPRGSGHHSKTSVQQGERIPPTYFSIQ